HGVKAAAMHGDLTQGQRQRALERFDSGVVTTLIATDVAARGLDLDDVTHVINFDPPEDGKAYTHRVGLTGRAGRSGTGVTLVLPEQQADMSRVARLNGHPETFAETGMKTAAPKLVYSSRRRGSKWGPVRPRRKICRRMGAASRPRIADPTLAPAGEQRIRWVERHSPVLNRLARGRLADGALRGRRVAVVRHLPANA